MFSFFVSFPYDHLLSSIPQCFNLSRFSVVPPMTHLCQQQPSIPLQQQSFSFCLLSLLSSMSLSMAQILNLSLSFYILHFRKVHTRVHLNNACPVGAVPPPLPCGGHRLPLHHHCHWALGYAHLGACQFAIGEGRAVV